MGYFSTGCEGLDYAEAYCSRCVNEGPQDGPGCWIWAQQFELNYKVCQDRDHWLHKLIPLDSKIGNGQCVMFRRKDSK